MKLFYYAILAFFETKKMIKLYKFPLNVGFDTGLFMMRYDRNEKKIYLNMKSIITEFTRDDCIGKIYPNFRCFIRSSLAHEFGHVVDGKLEDSVLKMKAILTKIKQESDIFIIGKLIDELNELETQREERASELGECFVFNEEKHLYHQLVELLEFRCKNKCNLRKIAILNSIKNS